MPDEIVVNVEGEVEPAAPVIIEVPAPVIDPAQVEMIRVTAECVAELRSLRDEVQLIRGEWMGIKSDIQTAESLHTRIAELSDRLGVLELADEIEEIEEIEAGEVIATEPANVEAALITEGNTPAVILETPKSEVQRKRGFVSL